MIHIRDLSACLYPAVLSVLVTFTGCQRESTESGPVSNGSVSDQISNGSEGDRDYVGITRMFAEAIAAKDYDSAWSHASAHLRSKMSREEFETKCVSFFEQFPEAGGVGEVDLNFAGTDLALELPDLDSDVPVSQARAWTTAGFESSADITVGAILVKDNDGLKIGDFWLYDD